MSTDNDRGWNIAFGKARNWFVAQLLWKTKDGQLIPPLWVAIIIFGLYWAATEFSLAPL